MKIEVPPQSINDAQAAIAKKERFAYVVVGAQNTDAWNAAIAADAIMGDMVLIWMKNPQDAAAWRQDATKAAIFFGKCGTPQVELSQSDAEDSDQIIAIITAAKQAGCK